MSPNIVGWAALLGWPVLVLTTLAGARSHLARTTAWMMFLPVMFLPTAVELKVPGIPGMNKHRLAFASIAVGLALFHRDRIARGARFGRAVLLLLVAGAVATVLTNADDLVYGRLRLPGLRPYDILNVTASILLDYYLPFTVGQLVFWTRDDLRDLFRVFSSCGLIYLPLAAIELRLSPVLNYWVYGFFPHQFLQMVRGSGYRPLVFMSHGLAVAFFAATGLAATLAVRRSRERCQPRPATRVALQALFVALCKSMGSIIYSAFAVAVEPLLRRRAGAMILVAVAAVVITFPVTRFTRLFPTEALVSAASRVSIDRSLSLDYRFQNEDMLLHKAAERPLFGWGTYGRNRVFDEWGDDQSVTDGQWIIVLGMFGITGLGGQLLLLLAPVVRYARRQRRMAIEDRALVGTLALIVTLCGVDMLPNAWNDALPLAYAGALYTLTGELSRRRREPQDEPAEAAPPAPAGGPVPASAGAVPALRP